MGQVPGILRLAKEDGFGTRRQSEFRTRGFAKGDQACAVVAKHQLAVVIGYVVAKEATPMGCDRALVEQRKIFEQERYPCERAVGYPGVDDASGFVSHVQYDGVDRGVDFAEPVCFASTRDTRGGHLLVVGS